jgi:hypothetical protein
MIVRHQALMAKLDEQARRLYLRSRAQGVDPSLARSIAFDDMRMRNRRNGHAQTKG